MQQGVFEKKKAPEHEAPKLAPKEFSHSPAEKKKKEAAAPISPSMSEGLMALKESQKVEADARARYEKFLRVEIEALKRAAARKKKKRLKKRRGKKVKDDEQKPPEK
jgi:hypothetical protein